MNATPPRYSPFEGPLRTDGDILHRIGQLIPPESRQWRSLVLFFLDANVRALPVDDVPEDPEPAVVENLCWILSQVLDGQEPEASVVIMTDLIWRKRLADAATGHGARVRLMCLATPSGLLALSSA